MHSKPASPLRTYLDECRALSDKATPGPWNGHRSTTIDGEWVMGIDMPKGKDLPDYHWESTDRTVGSEWDNAAFIAASREAIPRLLEMVEVALRGLEGSCYCDDPAYRGVEPCDACECLEELSTLAGKGE